jgi:hypothetical protein
MRENQKYCRPVHDGAKLDGKLTNERCGILQLLKYGEFRNFLLKYFCVVSKPALLPSLLMMKCPVCRKGSIFKNPNAYNLRTVGTIHALCPVCGQNFRPEPGFYFGGAMVSYALMVTFNVAVAVVFYFIVGDLFHHYIELMTVLLLASLLITPLMFRCSRTIWLYIVFKYREEKL